MIKDTFVLGSFRHTIILGPARALSCRSLLPLQCALPPNCPAPELYPRREYTLSLIHISEPTRLGMISYAVFCLKKKNKKKKKKTTTKKKKKKTKKKTKKQKK